MSDPIRRLLVLGGGSELAVAFAQRCIESGLDSLVLAGRAGGTVDAAAADLLREHPDVRIDVAGFDAAAPATHSAALRALHDTHGPFDTVLIAFGRLGPPFGVDQDPAGAAELVLVNFAGAVSATLASLAVLKDQSAGRLVVLSSITALRPRVATLVHGSAKAGLDAFLVGLAEPAARAGVTLTIVRPGFVHGRMTAGRTPTPFATTPAEVAEDMVRGVLAGRTTVHSPNALAPVGRLMRALPASVWRRVSNR